MKFKTKKFLEGEWFKFNEEVELLIRPFPNSKHPFSIKENLTIGDFNCVIFRECVLDWRGVEDEEGNPLKCDTYWKNIIFDLNDGKLFKFVEEKQNELKNTQEEEVKN